MPLGTPLDELADGADAGELDPGPVEVVDLVDRQHLGDLRAIDLPIRRDDDEGADLTERLVVVMGLQPGPQNVALPARLGNGVRDWNRPAAALIPDHPFVVLVPRHAP